MASQDFVLEYAVHLLTAYVEICIMYLPYIVNSKCKTAFLKIPSPHFSLKNRMEFFMKFSHIFYWKMWSKIACK